MSGDSSVIPSLGEEKTVEINTVQAWACSPAPNSRIVTARPRMGRIMGVRRVYETVCADEKRVNDPSVKDTLHAFRSRESVEPGFLERLSNGGNSRERSIVSIQPVNLR